MSTRVWRAVCGCSLLLAAGCGSSDTVVPPAGEPEVNHSVPPPVENHPALPPRPTTPPPWSNPAGAPSPDSLSWKTPAVKPKHCGVNLKDPEIAKAAAKLKPWKDRTGRGWRWIATAVQGNFDPCAPLSAAVVTVEDTPVNPPWHVLLFHNGHYLGRATESPYDHTVFSPSMSTSDTVAFRYDVYPHECTDCLAYPRVLVRYHWTGKKVQMQHGPPPKQNKR